jgi:hypothetical protein
VRGHGRGRGHCQVRRTTAELTDSNALRRLATPLQDEIAAFISGRIEAEQAPREHVDTNEDVPADDLRRAVEGYAQTFAAAYPAAPAIAPGNEYVHCTFPAPNSPPDQWHEKHVTTLLHFMAVVQWHLRESIKRLKGTVGRELPVYVMTKFMRKVTATLREALHLHDVQIGVQKRAHALCEPDEEVVARREAVKKRRTALEQLQWVASRD